MATSGYVELKELFESHDFQCLDPFLRLNVVLPGSPLTYFNDGGVRRIFLGLTFWPKGIFLGL